jgi:hypothetical protein
VAAAKLPLVVAAIVVPIVAGFYFGGPAVGLPFGALVAVAIVAVAVQQRPRGAIGAAPAPTSTRRLLIVLVVPLEDPAAIGEIAASAAAAGGPPAEVMLLAPARIGFLDRWASDVEGARRAAQERSVISVASLAKVGIEAEARVGDEDLVQAVEDQIGSFAATEVILVSAASEDDRGAEAAAAELGSRLQAKFRWLTVSGPAAR